MPRARHCERSEAIQNLSTEAAWIASSQGLLAMTMRRQLRRWGADNSHHIVRANMRKPGAPVIASKAGSRFSSAKTNPALA
jgi:hypothetical protein